MSRSFFKNVNVWYLLFYILPLALVFYGTVSRLYGQSNIIFDILLSTRGVSLIVFSLVGIFLTRNYSAGQLSKSAFFFSIYTFLSTLIIDLPTDFIVIAATIFFWPITLWIGEKSYFNNETFKVTAYLVAVICNLMSITTITCRTNVELLMDMDLEHSVGAANSIYLVLSTLPFVFLIPNKKILLTALILPMLAIIISNKTTCLFAVLISIGYFFLEDIRNSKNKLQFILSIFIFFFIIVSYGLSVIEFDLNMITEAISDDLDSGGNGRTNIIANVLNIYCNNDIGSMIFGSGFMAVAKDTNLSAHNDFLEILYDYGLIGFILFISFWICLFKKRRSLPKGSTIYMVHTISMIIYFICCLGSNFIIQQINMLFFALLWGTVDKYQINKNE